MLRIEDIKHDRRIPGEVMRKVFERDDGKCIKCGSSDNLYFDHQFPYTKGVASIGSKNIQLLYSRHNLKKETSFCINYD